MGKGVAYSTTEAAHLLNVRAESMSVLAGDPGHFARRFEAEGGSPRGFAERRFFAAYLAEILNEAVESGCTELVEDEVVRASRAGEGWSLGFADGSTAQTDALVVAVGNQEPDTLPAFEGIGPRFVRNPWGDASFGAYFFLLTGFHGTHVLTGVVILVSTAIRLAGNRSTKDGVEMAGLYWHFVDLVWVFIFTLFYLL